jgi:hypothetical protein
MINEKLLDIDIFELYSFAIYLYGYGYLYNYVLDQKLTKGIIITILTNFMTNYFFKYNTLTFISHSYWIKNQSNIAVPQLLSCLSNLLCDKYFENSLISLPANIFIQYTISNFYFNENKYSKNLRNLIFSIYIIKKIFF